MQRKILGMVFALVTVSLAAQTTNIPRPPTNFDSMMQQGGLVDFHTMDELDRKRQEQVETKSEATLSRLDLKAPGRARAEYGKGLQSLFRKDYQKAASSFAKAIAVYPEYVAAHNALGCAYFSLKQKEQARDEFARAVQLDDHLSGSYLNLGRAQLALGAVPAAQMSLEKASAISPLDTNLLMALTYVQLLNHDYPAVTQTAQRTHGRSHPGAAIVHYFSAAAWQEQNRLEEAQNELQTFLTEDPNSPFAAQARQILEQIKSRADAPPATTQASVSFDGASSQVSLLGQKALQDFREKQQIADAEAEGSPGFTRDVAEARKSDPVEGPSLEFANEGKDRNYSGWTLRSRVNEVSVFFTATDHGKAVTDLAQGEVAVRDDQKPPATILGFRSESGLPLRLGLLIDTSESVTDRFAFEQAAAANFLRQVLTGKEDRAFVAGFSNSVVLVQDFTADQSLMSRGINELVPVGGTALWDAVSFAVDKLVDTKETQPVARVLVVISDGDDNSSSATLKQAIERAERDEVIVYTVSTREVDPGNDLVSAGNHAMRVLAELTGGAAFFPGSANRLNHGLGDLQEVIRSRYLISYKPALFRRDGRYRMIDISAKRSGHKLKVHSRKGYYTEKGTRG
jgi:VWFA-related protein